MSKSRMEQHVDLVGALNIGLGALILMIAVIIFIVVAGGGLIAGLASGEMLPTTITLVVASAIAALLIVLSVPGIVGGVGLLKRKPWARILVLVMSFLNLLDFPLGTALGIYSIWVLMNDEAQVLFAPDSGS